MSDIPLLRLVGVAKSFGAVRALHGIDLTVETGEVVSIIGPSGCGKSTLLRCINFLDEPDAGQVYFRGEPIGVRVINGRRHRDGEANINRMRAQIGMVFQQLNVWPHLSVLDNVVTPQLCVAQRTRADAERRAHAQLGRVGMSDKVTSFPSELSGGQLQRVAIARALAMDPDLMLFDEPTSSLDAELVEEVLAVMRELARARRTMIIVTHELHFSARVSDRIIFMNEGRIVEEGPPEAVLTNPRSERLRRFLSKVLYYEQGPKLV
jgi:polar amino acid transport system ATP-binding protein